MEKLLRLIWILVSIGLSIFIIIKLIDIGISIKYEVEEPLMKGEDLYLVEKSRLFNDLAFVYKMFLLYILFSLVIQVRSLVRLVSNKNEK